MPSTGTQRGTHHCKYHPVFLSGTYLAKTVSGFVQHALLVWVICLFLAGEDHSIAGGRAGHSVPEVARAAGYLVFCVCGL